jgi:hypothetical protein
MCVASASLRREERFTNPGMSVISSGNRQLNSSSCTSIAAFSRSANSLARVDFPAAILPNKNINFAVVLMAGRLGIHGPRADRGATVHTPSMATGDQCNFS